ncbi:MAG TPA: DUF4442 domain-containing protein [Nevskiaceae bacterium]|nr:DUF4442 domain-containing protein [Nevskiaceae bacterium]
MSQPNALARALAATQKLPAPLRRAAMTKLFTFKVKFAGTGGVKIEEAGEGRAVLTMRNRRRVQNHIGGIHAAGMALLAESATGVAFGLSVRDSHLPLLKSMKIDYVRRAQGDLRAEATLSADQRETMQTQDKGDAVVAVKVTDAAGEEPIRCVFVWAWVPKKR